MSEKELLEPRTMPSQERARKTVAAIYEAAAHVFTEIGYPDATTDQVAERAGISIGTLYHYFSGKEAILYGLWERHMDEIKTTVQQVDKDIRRQGCIDRGIVPILMHVVLELVSYENVQNRLFVSPTGLPETILQKRRQLGLYIEATMEAVFRDFADVRIMNPKIGIHIIWATVQAVVHDYVLLPSDEIKKEDLISELSDMMSRYVFTDDAEEIIIANSKTE
jgi:AcrR family transcriptional regulator